MAKPDLRRLFANAKGRIVQLRGTGLEPIDLIQNVQRKILKRTGGLFKANTPLDLTEPGPGWAAFGSLEAVEDELDLFVNIKIYRNGQLLMSNNGASPDFDFSFIEKNKVAFIFSVRTSEVLQISKNFIEQ